MIVAYLHTVQARGWMGMQEGFGVSQGQRISLACLKGLESLLHTLMALVQPSFTQFVGHASSRILPSLGAGSSL